MQISIVIPSFNQGVYIGETIKSILDQKEKDVEIIIVDNKSTDKTKEILEKYKNQIKIISEKDRGQTDAINKGMEMAKGDILAYLNSDDYYEPGSLKTVREFFRDNTEAKIIYGQGKLVDEKGRMIRMYKTEHPTLDSLFRECVISQPTVFMRREVFEKIGEFDTNLNYAMDYDYWIRVGKKYRFHYIDRILASTRIHPKSKTAQSEKVFEGILKVLKKNYGKVSDEAVFNYAFVKERSSVRRIKAAFETYRHYKQLPRKKGFIFFGRLMKSLLLKKG